MGGSTLWPGSSPPSPGLAPCADLDLQLVGVHQVVTGHAEASAGDLLDGALFGIAIFHRDKSLGIFAAFTGVRLSAEPVHGHGEGFVRFFGNGTVGHGSRFKAFHDFAGGLDFVDGNGLGFVEFELHEAADGVEIPGLIIDQFGVLRKNLGIAETGRLLQKMDGLRIEKVTFSVGAPLVNSAGIERFVLDFAGFERVVVTEFHLFGNGGNANAFDAAGGSGEIFVDDFFVQPDALENLGTAITGHGGNSHLGHGLDDAFDAGFEIFFDGGVVLVVEFAVIDHAAEWCRWRDRD